MKISNNTLLLMFLSLLLTCLIFSLCPGWVSFEQRKHNKTVNCLRKLGEISAGPSPGGYYNFVDEVCGFDGWGRVIRFEVDKDYLRQSEGGFKILITSNGRDGVPNTLDDIGDAVYLKKENSPWNEKLVSVILSKQDVVAFLKSSFVKE